jgi:hypothetical protein
MESRLAGLIQIPVSGLDSAAVERQVRRILSVGRPAGGWVEASRRDPVLGRLQAGFPGVRLELFRSPYEPPYGRSRLSGATGRRRPHCGAACASRSASRSSSVARLGMRSSFRNG